MPIEETRSGDGGGPSHTIVIKNYGAFDLPEKGGVPPDLTAGRPGRTEDQDLRCSGWMISTGQGHLLTLRLDNELPICLKADCNAAVVGELK